MACKKTDCVYYTSSDWYKCNYLTITGMSKLAQIPKGEKYDVDRCQFYKRGRKQRAAIDPPIVRNDQVDYSKEASTIDSEVAFQLYDEKLTDSDIGRLLNIHPNAVAKWRKRNGLTQVPEAETRDLKGVTKLIQQGYSPTAISKLMSFSRKTIELCKEALQKGEQDGSVNEDENHIIDD